jgi:SAM-dependent methyltransferase
MRQVWSTARDRDVGATLRHIGVHESWSSGYRTPENEAFYDLAFDHIARVFGSPGEDVVLDAGCGSCTKSIQLARRGYSVLGVDLSDKVLEVGQQEAAEAGLGDRIALRCEDLTSMTLADGSFGRVLCWGVLMHIPEVDRAIAELTRVVRLNGLIVVSEGNMRSLQAVAMRLVKRLLHRERGVLRDTAAGLEVWEETPTGKLMTRQARIEGIVRSFGDHGARLVSRRAGELSELFTVLPWKPARRLVHAVNSLWFRWPALAGPAFGNLLVFRKDA